MVKEFKKFDGDLLLTTACPVECDFCIYQCNPNGAWMPESTIERVAQEYTTNEVGIRISGGEPFYDLDKLRKCIDIVLKYQEPHEVLVITSGFFANSREQTEKALKLLKEKKLDTLVVSVDRFHVKQVPLSSLLNIVEGAKNNEIKVILRVTTDEKSYQLMDQLAEMIVEHEIKFEPHEQYGVYGKAELLDPSLRDNAERRKEYFERKILEFAAKRKKLADIEHYLEQSPKRSQRKYASKFYPTTFPNGNVYADSQCAKGSFMGNINKESLAKLIESFSKTLPGHILLSEHSECSQRMRVFLPNMNDECDYCRNHPLAENMPEEAIGRQYMTASPRDDFGPLLLKAKKTNRELLLSFHLEEQDLNPTSGKRILDFLESLRKDSVRFRISKPIPRCLFGLNYTKVSKPAFPKDCYDCSELFLVENGEVVSCRSINKKGPKIGSMDDRKKIYEYFNALRLQKKPLNKCQACIYFVRKQCDGLCFRQ
jgi:MoaA/NifB/PqqE/SkfB family radical SAM enzyme